MTGSQAFRILKRKSLSPSAIVSASFCEPCCRPSAAQLSSELSGFYPFSFSKSPSHIRAILYAALPFRSAQRPSHSHRAFHDRARAPCSLNRRFNFLPLSVADFAARRRQIILIIFCRDMRVTKNSSQAASVEIARRWRAIYERSSLHPLIRKACGFSDDSKK